MQIRFSEPITISYKSFMEHSFRVSGATVTSAKRVDGQNDLWEIAVKPESSRKLTVSIIGGRPCDQDGAVCTGDGNTLQGNPTISIEGPGG